MLRPNKTDTTVEEITRFLRRKAREQGLRAKLFPAGARFEGNFLTMPADLPRIKSAWRYATRLQELEDTWNERRPRPAVLLRLFPAAAPVLD